MMSRQTMIALGVAVVLGLLAVYIANIYIGGSKQQAELGGTTKVAVASVPMAYGTELTPDKVRFVDYPNSAIPPGSFTNANQLMPPGQKRFALLTMGINEPILAAKISAPGAGASIAALLPDGMRAATVRIDDVSGVAGFIQPNDSVDVLITRQIQGAQNATQVTDVLLQNVQVMAIDQDSKNSDGTPKVARTATLQVAPLDAQKLALAQQAGSLSLVLRKPGEQNNPVVETVSMNDLRYSMYGGARYPAPAVVGGFSGAIAGAMDRTSALIANTNSQRSAPRRSVVTKRANPAPQKPSVEIYRGTTSNQYKVGE
ncbi:MAG TPA: Flp pilus assembly protein CpaB [Sphingomicrobium sp.]